MDKATPKKPAQVFENIKIIILSENDNLTAVLTKAFTNRGGSVKSFSNGKDAVAEATKEHCHVLVATNDVKYNDANWVAHEIRYKNVAQIDLLWYIGNKKIKKMDGFIKKPFRPIALLTPIFTALVKKGIISKTTKPKATKSKKSASKAKSKPRSGQSILIVDDDAELLNLVVDIFEETNHKVITATSGKDAIDLIQQNLDIGIIFVDLKMPAMTGFQFISTLKSMGLADQRAIVILTGNTDKDNLAKGVDLGVESWVSKPFDPQLLLNTVEKLVQKKIA